MVEVKSRPRGASQLLDGVWRLAKVLAEDPDLTGLLVLYRPRLGQERIEAEREQSEDVLRPDVGSRLRWVVVTDPDLEDFPADLGQQVRDAVAHEVAQSERRRGASPERGFASLAVLHVLLDRWLRSEGPMHTNELTAAVGCSYPTAASALEEFKEDIARGSDRRIELCRWPRLPWLRYIGAQEKARDTERYVDRSGSPRAASDLVRRLQRLGRHDVAIGGALGALHHVPSLDVVGTPTLALTLHDPNGRASSAFVERLDPALARTESRDETPLVVVHRQRLEHFLANKDESGTMWADPVECLLDLHEAGVEGLAEPVSICDRQPEDKGLMDDDLLLPPRAVLQRVSDALPPTVRERVIVVGSLAAGFHFFGEQGGMEVRTKDADCLLSPRSRGSGSRHRARRRIARGGLVLPSGGRIPRAGTIRDAGRQAAGTAPRSAGRTGLVPRGPRCARDG